MDYETLLSLAESGDTKAMITIGGMYADFQGDKKNLDLEEAFKWFARSGEYGDVNGMKLAASIGCIDGHILLKIAPFEWEHAMQKLTQALYWAEKALENGDETAESEIIDIKDELGVASLFASIHIDKDAGNEQIIMKYIVDAVNYFKTVYKKTKTDESSFHLGASLFSYNSHLHHYNQSISDSDAKLMVESLTEYATAHAYTEKDVGIAYGYLGNLYTWGIGCNVDYNKAFEYLTIATEKCNFDCSSELKHFKKKLFGGYTYIG